MIDRAALDRHRTGNHGWDYCREVEEEPVCSKPGRYGCGVCIGCEMWADRELEER